MTITWAIIAAVGGTGLREASLTDEGTVALTFGRPRRSH
jgi:hypothetical protein